jgi:hypothetical protein
MIELYIFRKWAEAVKPIKSPRPATMRNKKRKGKRNQNINSLWPFKKNGSKKKNKKKSFAHFETVPTTVGIHSISQSD